MDNHPVLLGLAIAVIAPLLAEIPIGFRLPAVVLEMVLGVIVGPQVLHLAKPEGLIAWLGGNLGVSALFFMAGLDLDLQRVRGQPMSLAARGWGLSFALAVAVAWLLHAAQIVRDPMMIAVALSTSGLGIIMPILKDAHELDTEFGRYIIAAGAAGEFGPVVFISLVLTRAYSGWVEILLMLAFVAIAFGAARVALGARPPAAIRLLTRTMESSNQLPVRLSLLLLAGLVVLSQDFGFEAAPGAFAAGMVVGLATQGDAGKALRAKIEGVCFGLLVPFFYILSGMKFDLRGLFGSTTALILVPVFLALLFAIRGAPVIFYRAVLTKGERLPFALYSATTLSIVVVVTQIGQANGHMSNDTAAAMVGASLLSVLLFPAIGGALRPKSVVPEQTRL
jgi:Kef-type K+ transport system membrane component KefB